MKPRTLIILGVVLAVVFVVGIGAGAGGGKGSTVDLNDLKNASWRASLDQVLTRKLDPVNDMTLQSGAGCVVQPAQIAVPVGSACAYKVGSTFIPLNRRLTLTILGGASARYALDQPDGLPVSNTISAGGTGLDIYKSGGTLSLLCLSASSGTCVMRVD